MRDVGREQEKLRVRLHTQADEERRRHKEAYFRELYGGAQYDGLGFPVIRPVRQKNHWGFPVTIEVELQGPYIKSIHEKEQTFMQRRSTIQTRLRQLEAELAALARFPDDNYDNGTVVKFERVVNRGTENEKTWLFAAMKFGNLWYLTAQRGKVVTWETLCEFAGDSEILVADTWTTAVVSKEAFEGERTEVKTDEAEVK